MVTSSGLGTVPAPYCLPYSCSKSFVGYLARGLSFELEGKVECIDWALGQVKTNLNKDPKGPNIQTAPDSVHGIFRQLGKMRSSYGVHDSALFAAIGYFSSEDSKSKMLKSIFE